MFHWLNNDHHAETIAFATTLACVAASGQAALKVPHRTARIFGALALFTLNWAILSLFYLPGPPQNEALAAFSGYLLIHVGVMLVRAHVDQTGDEARERATWVDALPLQLLRSTVVGFGGYVLLRWILHKEYGFGTLALALWGSALTIMGYVSLWVGIAYLYRGAAGRRAITAWMAALLFVYSGCEVAYGYWYTREYWPVYSGFLRMETAPGAPPFAARLPVHPEADWPAAAQWAALSRSRNWPRIAAHLDLRIEPDLPDMWIWLKYAYSVLKLALTAAVIWLVWRRPVRPRSGDPTPMFDWLDRQFGIAS